MHRTLLRIQVLVLACWLAAPASAQVPPPAEPDVPNEVSPEVLAAGQAAFADVYQVLLSPRCVGCHPAGDRPLVGDDARPHPMNISRKSGENGLFCSACHQQENVEAIPGGPLWSLPDADVPLVFEGRDPAALCHQLVRSEEDGGMGLSDQLQHVTTDPLVLWSWNAGGTRTPPPLSHDAFQAAYRAWVEAGGPCPDAVPVAPVEAEVRAPR